MTLDDSTCYRALIARDARFDGVFFVGVKTTGIYCRPVCTARTPGRDRCRFFASAALAEREGFRPCLRCRPELAPGHAPIDGMRNVARAIAARIEAGELRDGRSVAELARQVGLSDRQLRRTMRQELGVSPVELAQTNRLLMAKRLIAETQLPMTQIAFASGFESVRRFNASFRSHYRLTPSAMRRASTSVAADSLCLTLAYRPPIAWCSLLRFLADHAVPHVECVTFESYARTVTIGKSVGWLKVCKPDNRHLLTLEISTSLVPVLATVLPRIRSLFDLDARPDVIVEQLQSAARLAPIIHRQPGLRVPGAFDSFELGVRTILGQQVSVRGASTLAGRLVERFGTPVQNTLACLNRTMPSAQMLAAESVTNIAKIGIPQSRARTLHSFATAIANGTVDLTPGNDPSRVADSLLSLPGIGPWTTEYIAMRALRWPDAFPASDLGLRKASGASSARALERESGGWSPWRAYAAMHLWETLYTKVQAH